MAVHPSVIKRHRQSLKRRAKNQNIKSMIKTLIKKAKRAIEGKDRNSALSQLREVNSALDRAVKGGVLKRNTASRWLSRLARSASAIGQQA